MAAFAINFRKSVMPKLLYGDCVPRAGFLQVEHVLASSVPTGQTTECGLGRYVARVMGETNSWNGLKSVPTQWQSGGTSHEPQGTLRRWIAWAKPHCTGKLPFGCHLLRKTESDHLAFPTWLQCFHPYARWWLLSLLQWCRNTDDACSPGIPSL